MAEKVLLAVFLTAVEMIVSAGRAESGDCGGFAQRGSPYAERRVRKALAGGPEQIRVKMEEKGI